MQDNSQQTPALEHLKQSYDEIGIPDDVRQRIFQNLFESHPEKRRVSLFRLSLAGAALVLVVLMSGAYLLGVFEKESASNTIADSSSSGVLPSIIEQVEGNATVVFEGGDKVIVRPRMPIKGGSLIRTDDRSKVALSIGPHTAEAWSDTVLRIGDIKKNRLAFSLDKGKVKMTVAPLGNRGTMIIVSGGLTVEVVGTVFTVISRGDCSTVQVTKGKVKTTFERVVDYVAAGENQRFCKKQVPKDSSIPSHDTIKSPGEADTEVVEMPQPALQDEEPHRLEKPEPLEGHTRDTDKKEPSVSLKSQSNEDEQLYNAALHSLVKGKTGSALGAFTEYLERYPGGTFAEDAMFNTIRLSYESGRMRLVEHYGRRFISTYKASRRRSIEVRILYAQSVIELGRNPIHAYRTLAPVVSAIQTVPVQYQSQAVYLFFHAAYRTNQFVTASRWAAYYVKRFPGGQYRGEAQKVIEAQLK